MMNDFAEILSFLMKEKGISGKDLAEMTGISQVVISRYKRGYMVPGMRALIKLATALDVSIDALIGYGGNDARIESAKRQIQGLEKQIREIRFSLGEIETDGNKEE